MVRLVKGAYWDTEIKRAQVDGLRRLSGLHAQGPHRHRLPRVRAEAAREPRRRLPAVRHAQRGDARRRARARRRPRRLRVPVPARHGRAAVRPRGRRRTTSTCRAASTRRSARTRRCSPTWCARLLENGANTSFVNQVADERVDLERLVAGSGRALRARFAGSPHPRIPLPSSIYPDRRNSAGLDLADEHVLASLERRLDAAARRTYAAHPLLATASRRQRRSRRRCVRRRTSTIVVGQVVDATPRRRRSRAGCVDRRRTRHGAALPATERAAILERAADLLEARAATLLHLAIREAGKTLANAVGEVREAADFCRYYARQSARARACAAARHDRRDQPVELPARDLRRPGRRRARRRQRGHRQARRADAADRPRSDAPPARSRRSARSAAVPAGARRDRRRERSSPTRASTASSSPARPTSRRASIARSRKRGNLPLVAETGGQNAMIVDASALPEQVVTDVVGSAFDSAGQRCSALRVLCVQDEIADRVLEMLAGAMRGARRRRSVGASRPTSDRSSTRDAKRTLDDARRAHAARGEARRARAAGRAGDARAVTSSRRWRSRFRRSPR